MILLFTAKWCGHCKPLKDKLVEENIEFTSIDIEDDKPSTEEYLQLYNIKSLPTTIIIRDNEIKKVVGNNFNAIKECLN